MVEKSVDCPPTVPQYCWGTPCCPPTTTDFASSSFDMVTYEWRIRPALWHECLKGLSFTEKSEHELAHLTSTTRQAHQCQTMRLHDRPAVIHDDNLLRVEQRDIWRSLGERLALLTQPAKSLRQ